jgi:ankyrin repeat protein
MYRARRGRIHAGVHRARAESEGRRRAARQGGARRSRRLSERQRSLHEHSRARSGPQLGPAETVEELLELGADPNFEALDGFPALVGVILSERDDKPVVFALLLHAGADVDRRGLNDWTPLHAAAAQDDPELVGDLLRAGADPAGRTTIDDYETPLELALRAGKLRAAAALEPGSS